jgi:pimeloyl-ACP methyl ester carboxylesterase
VHLGRPPAAAAVCVALLASLTVGCGSGSDPADTASGGGLGSPSPAASGSAPSPSVSGGMSRPLCAEPDEGEFRQPASGPGAVTPVLLLGSGTRGVVLGGQADGGICQMLPYGRELADRGYHVALFEWRDPYPQAMTTATGALVAAGARRVVLGGFSRGALVALGIAPTAGDSVVGVFSVSGGPSEGEGFATVRSLSRFRGPILLVTARDDDVFPPGTTRSIATRHRGPEQVLVLPGYDHALRLLEGDHGPTVRAALLRFLARTTRSPVAD